MKEAGFTLFMILVFTVITTSVSGHGSSEAVMDYRRNPVKPNVPYFIQPAGEPDLWISHSRRFMEVQCPQVAVLSSISLVAVVFLQQPRAYYISLDTNISIRYEGYDICPESGIWRVDQNSPFPTRDISATGSVFTPNSTFQIKKGNDGVYKFVYESVNVGVYTDPTTRIKHLVLNRIPLNVIFVPVNEEEGHETSTFLKTMAPFMY